MLKKCRMFGLIIFLSAFPVSAVHAQMAPQGNIAVARARGDAMVIWDATQALTDLVATKASKKDVINRLTSDAALVFGTEALRLKRYAKTVSVIVLYTKTGAISPTYHVATFEGVERLLVFKAPSRASGQAHAWASQLLRGVMPRGAFVAVVGQLPPELR